MEKTLCYLFIQKGDPVKIEILGKDKGKVESLKGLKVDVMDRKERDELVKYVMPAVKEKFENSRKFRQKLLENVGTDVLKDLITADFEV